MTPARITVEIDAVVVDLPADDARAAVQRFAEQLAAELQTLPRWDAGAVEGRVAAAAEGLRRA